MQSLKCKFCNQDTEKINQYYEVNILLFAWRCEPCQTRFLSTNDYQIVEIKIYCQINNTRYCAKFTYDELASSNTVNKFELLQMWNLDDIPILSLNNFPNISPSNIKEKICTLLLFK